MVRSDFKASWQPSDFSALIERAMFIASFQHAFTSQRYNTHESGGLSGPFLSSTGLHKLPIIGKEKKIRLLCSHSVHRMLLIFFGEHAWATWRGTSFHFISILPLCSIWINILISYVSVCDPSLSYVLSLQCGLCESHSPRLRLHCELDLWQTRKEVVPQ